MKKRLLRFSFSALLLILGGTGLFAAPTMTTTFAEHVAQMRESPPAAINLVIDTATAVAKNINVGSFATAAPTVNSVSTIANPPSYNIRPPITATMSNLNIIARTTSTGTVNITASPPTNDSAVAAMTLTTNTTITTGSRQIGRLA